MRYRIDFSSKTLANPSVYIVSSVREPGSSHPVRKIVKKLGKKLDLLATDPHALEKLQAKVDEMNTVLKNKRILDAQASSESFSKDFFERLEKGELDADAQFESRSLGLVALGALYERLSLDYKMRYIQRNARIQYDFPQIVRDLVLLRILQPCSKLRSSIRGAEEYLGFRSTNVDHMYKALDLLHANKRAIVGYLNKQIKKQIPHRNTRVCLYDITTYAFESVNQDDLRDFGYSKDKKFNEVQVVMALATDQDGLPLDYAIYKGNQAEAATLVPFVHNLKKQFGIEGFIVVADRGLNCKGNIDALVKLGHDYVLSSKVRGASGDIKKMVLDPTGRIEKTKIDADGVVVDEVWYKEIEVSQPVSYIYPDYKFENESQDDLEELKTELNHATTSSGKTVKSGLKRRLIVTWSRNRAKKDEKDRERLVKKARRLLEKPHEISANFKRGGRSYLEIDMDSDSARLDINLINEQKKFDGIHVVETSLDAPAGKVLEIYGDLWRIENSFRNLKSTMMSRPVFVRLEDHVRGHFLICFLALAILRLLEFKLKEINRDATVDEIIHSLNLARIALIKPTTDMEFFASEGITETFRDILGICGLTAPAKYELGNSLRRKLRLYEAVRDMFTSTTVS